jgi:hypothetical protein
MRGFDRDKKDMESELAWSNKFMKEINISLPHLRADILKAYGFDLENHLYQVHREEKKQKS